MIEIRGLAKNYGATRALQPFDLDIGASETFGLVGPNGAGKTTLIRILATLLKPSAGTASICGIPLERGARRIRPLIGYLPDHFGLYEDMRVAEYLQFFASAYGIRGQRRRAVVQGVLDLTDLTSKSNDLIRTLSRGMQQRLGLARVLVHDPKVLLLDEPASGLDPRARIEIRELLKELRRMGKTILISSHILADLADVCTKIALIEKGRLLFSGPVRAAIDLVSRDDIWLVEVLEDPSAALAALNVQPFVAQAVEENGQIAVRLAEGSSEAHQIPRILMERGLRLRSFRRREVTLEEAFLRLTKGEVS